MIEYLQYFFSPRHLFNIRYTAMSNQAVLVLLLVFIVFIVAGIVSNLWLTKNKAGLVARGYQRLAYAFWTIGALGLVYVFFAWQSVALLGARFWLLALGLVFITWLVFIIRYFVKDVPVRRSKIENKKQKEKYIP